jgi:hypothetical protein
MLYDPDHMEASMDPQFDGGLLFTDAQKAQLQANGIVSREAIMLDGNTPDHVPVVKWFHPGQAATWLITEIEMDRIPNSDNEEKRYEPSGRAYGLCDLGLGYPEFGYVSISEVLGIGRYHKELLGIERDCYIILDKPISIYWEQASKEGRIIT